MKPVKEGILAEGINTISNKSKVDKIIRDILCEMTGCCPLK
jgi:hypothetical protein